MSKVDGLNIENLRLLIASEQVVWTEHLVLRMLERNIKRADAIECIENGEIIESYPDAYPYPACLVFAMLPSNNVRDDDKPLHVVAGIGENKLFIITVYYPTLQK